jgi:hypothetical protein
MSQCEAWEVTEGLGIKYQDSTHQGNPPLEPRGLEVEFFPKEEVLHEKVKIYG